MSHAQVLNSQESSGGYPAFKIALKLLRCYFNENEIGVYRVELMRLTVSFNLQVSVSMVHVEGIMWTPVRTVMTRDSWHRNKLQLRLR